MAKDKDFLSLADGQILLDWCRENIEKGHDLYKQGDKNIPASILDRNEEVTLGLCKKCGKGESELDEPCISNLDTILKITTLLCEGAECRCYRYDCKICQGTDRITNEPLAWAIFGTVLLPYCQRQQWWRDFVHCYRHELLRTTQSPQFSITDGARAVLEANPLAFTKALGGFLTQRAEKREKN